MRPFKGKNTVGKIRSICVPTFWLLLDARRLHVQHFSLRKRTIYWIDCYRQINEAYFSSNTIGETWRNITVQRTCWNISCCRVYTFMLIKPPIYVVRSTITYQHRRYCLVSHRLPTYTSVLNRSQQSEGVLKKRCDVVFPRFLGAPPGFS